MQRTLIKATPAMVGQTVRLQGWVDTKRDHGKLTFIDLRDRTGLIQIVGFQKMGELTVESVIEVVGLLKDRQERNVNPELVTGRIELEVGEYTILNKARELPLTVDTDGHEINEEVRLRFRYLDLRRARMQKIMRLRSQLIEEFRKGLFADDFVEIETPMLTKSTKEGSRDFVVPSRFQPGKFYALPQSPQQYKQLLMTAGFERYFQIARCIRDEDLRADRGFEFTQLDLEMSFEDRESVMAEVEKSVKQVITAVGGKLQRESFPVITYQEAMQKYGADRFDLRTEAEKQDGTLAFAWVIDFPFFKKVDKADAAEVRDGKSGWTFTHNPFSRPLPEHEANHLAQQNIGNILTTQYDLICNGYEVGGGSIRAHEPELLKATFKIMGYTDQQIEAGVGHMLEAFEVGTPPHGGIALGLDRLVMLLAQETSLKEAIAFPMTASGRTAVMDAPASLTDEQLKELHIGVKAVVSHSPHDAILERLTQMGLTHTYLSHRPVFTSQEAADVRGTSLKQAAKALVLQADKEFILVVIPGDQKLDLEKLREHLGAGKLAMASKESVLAKTGLEVGSIPPMGSVMGMRTVVDARLAENEQIAFNVGRHDRSIVMAYSDYLAAEKPMVAHL